MNRPEIASFMERAVRYTQTVDQEKLLEELERLEEENKLSENEKRELQEQAMRNLGIQVGVDLAKEQETPEPEDESIPKRDRPIILPRYTGVREELIRFSDAEWFNKVQEKTIILAGVGGIGSNLAVILAKLNPSSIYIFDSDNVETHNIAGQFYSMEDVGRPKVDALAASIIKYTNYHKIFAINRRYMSGESIVGDIMICGFDNMVARKCFYGNWKAHATTIPEEERGKCLFIDGRLSANELQIFCITGTDDYYMKVYERDYLFEDYQAERQICSFKQTGFLAQMIGSFIVNLLVNFCANQVNPARRMALPFMTSYKSDLMFLDFKR